MKIVEAIVKIGKILKRNLWWRLKAHYCEEHCYVGNRPCPICKIYKQLGIDPKASKKTTRKNYNYKKFIDVVKRAKTHIKNMGVPVSVKWEPVAYAIGAEHIRHPHNFFIWKTKPVFGNGKSLKDVETEMKVVFSSLGHKNDTRFIVAPKTV